MDYPINEEVFMYLKSLPVADRLEHIKLLRSSNQLDDDAFNLLIEIFNYSSSTFLNDD